MTTMFQPQGAFLLVRPIDVPIIKGRVIASADNKMSGLVGEVLAVGPGRITMTGSRETMDWKVGDIIFYPQGVHKFAARNSVLNNILPPDHPEADCILIAGVGLDAPTKLDRAQFDALMQAANNEATESVLESAAKMQQKMDLAAAGLS